MILVRLDVGNNRNCNRVQAINIACQRAARRNHPERPHLHTMPFGGLHFVAAGDFAQHPPVRACPLYTGVKSTLETTSKGRDGGDAGRKLWSTFDTIVMLVKQHRFDMSNPSGRALYRIISQLTHCVHPDTNAPLSSSDVGELVDLVNSRAISSNDIAHFLTTKPRVLVLRHVVRPSLNRQLVIHHAASDNIRPIVWREIDVGHGRSSTGRRLSSIVASLIQNVPTKNDQIPSVQYFYPGIPYRFISSDNVFLGWVNNGSCTGVRLILANDEPPDDGLGAFWILRRQPVAIIVRIDGRDFGELFGDAVPAGCLPIFPRRSTSPTTYNWGFPVKLFDDAKDTAYGTSIQAVRTGFPIETTMTFTDHYAQGQSFAGAPHLLHLTLPERQSYHRANLLVPLSRPATLDDVHLACPLYRTASQREQTIKKWTRALTLSDDYKTEMTRLTELSQQTKRLHSELFVADEPNTVVELPPTPLQTLRQPTIQPSSSTKCPHRRPTTEFAVGPSKVSQAMSTLNTRMIVRMEVK